VIQFCSWKWTQRLRVNGRVSWSAARLEVSIP